MRILLTTFNSKYIHSNLAIRILYQLNKHHSNLSWKEFTIHEKMEVIIDECLKYDVIAVSCYIWNINFVKLVIECVKEKKPDIKFLLGGPEVSYDWEELINANYADFIVTGEGEIPFSMFLTNYPNVIGINNLAINNNNEILYKKGKSIFDLNKLTEINPYANDNIEDLKNRILYIETSRGCPYHCEFCLASLDNNVRYLPIEAIKNNLFFLMQNGKVIKFLDRTFNIKKDFTIEMFTFILQHYKPNNVFQFEITADILHQDIINFVNKNMPKNLLRFEIGIQTVNQKANLEVKRKQNFEITKAIIKSVENKVELHVDLIVGLPYDYLSDIKNSFEQVFLLFAPELQFGFLKFLKGTPIRNRYSEFDFDFDPKPPYQIIKSKFLSETDLEKLSLIEEVLEIYWNKKRCANTLKYIALHYSIFDFLYELSCFFITMKAFNRYDLNDVYLIVNAFIEKNYPNDEMLKSMVFIDYFNFYKIKPKDIFNATIILKQNNFNNNAELNFHKFRYAFIPVEFNPIIWFKENKIVAKKDMVIFKYDGRLKPEILYSNGLINC